MRRRVIRGSASRAAFVMRAWRRATWNCWRTCPSPTAYRPEGAAGNATPPAPPRGGGFTNSDLAFRGTNVVVGNYHGFNTYDIENARKPRLLASVVCPGGQGDVSIYGNLLFMSVEQTRGRIDCGVQGVTAPVSAERFREAATSGGGADLPWLAHPHGGSGQERQGESVRLRFGHELGASG